MERGQRSRRHLEGDADMQEPKPKAAAGRRCWPLAVAIGALLAVLVTGAWAGYRSPARHHRHALHRGETGPLDGRAVDRPG
ncbi:hypothetical protein JOF47_001171 [Paeniglutamicibacter kerguelensis]|uniref:Uncharacterized protein n=1 Tax=Paeniglutamicibacter kerguelensis TaxID=254788 RepID=A0ABS4XB22_9MICC|nr:hypothetical protein [Paeniglutamicibacter kerguelensis]